MFIILESIHIILIRRANFKDMAIENKMGSSSKRKENSQNQGRESQQEENEESENDSATQ